MPSFIKFFAGLAGTIHVLFFVMESILWMNPKVHSRFLVEDLADAEAINVFIMNQGFYNLFLAMGIFAGLYIFRFNEIVGKTLVGYVSSVMLGAAIVLIFTVPAMVTGFIVQGLPPFIVLVYLIRNRHQSDAH